MSALHLFAAAAVDPSTLTIRRLVATVAALLALAGVVAGGLALARSARGNSVVAAAAGLIATVTGAFIVATAEGGPGTGYGVVGGYAALALGPIAVALGALARARSRRTA
jgi:hypothetical protein